MVSSIAVLFVHGVEVRDRRYAQAAIGRLRREFARRVGGRRATARGPNCHVETARTEPVDRTAPSKDWRLSKAVVKCEVIPVSGHE